MVKEKFSSAEHSQTTSVRNPVSIIIRLYAGYNPDINKLIHATQPYL